MRATSLFSIALAGLCGFASFAEVWRQRIVDKQTSFSHAGLEDLFLRHARVVGGQGASTLARRGRRVGNRVTLVAAAD